VFVSDDTIVAIATPAGRAGIGVVRLSGPESVAVATTLIRPASLTPRHATLVKLLDPADEATVDQVVATWFAAPHSYTGEDVVEISAHGSPVLLQRIVELAIQAGARLAEPGEFTFRAYLRGRLDLAQAEAVADLIDAVTPLQARAAMDQLEGTLTGAIGRIDAALFDLSARLEASLDYPDEGFHFSALPETSAAMSRITADLAELARDGRAGRVIREGRSVAIIGRPNAGKSSLFNALVGASRAIVTDIPGTTRDLLTERVDIEGLAITLVDTAGLREARDAIEAEGVKRARDAQRVSALKLIVIDGSAPITTDDRGFVADWSVPGLVVVSKADLPRAWSPDELGPAGTEVETIAVSARTGEGLAALRRRVFVALTAREDLRDPPAITNARHLALVDVALDAMSRAEAALADGATEELVLTDVTAARRALEEITGRRTTDDLLTHIFARFCLGK
jgi:tRNA modification GTPase